MQTLCLLFPSLHISDVAGVRSERGGDWGGSKYRSQCGSDTGGLPGHGKRIGEISGSKDRKVDGLENTNTHHFLQINFSI